MIKMQIGISSYTYTWAVGVPFFVPENPMTALNLLERAVELGVNVVQIADNLPLDALREIELEQLQGYARLHHLRIEVGTRGITPAHLARYHSLAHRFQSPILRVVIDTPDHHPMVDEVIDLLRPQMPAFETSGITLALENHDRFSCTDFLHILHSIDSPALGICLDTVNSFGALEGPGVVINTLARFTVNLHVKDFNIRRADHKMGFLIEGTPAGQGRLDVPNLIEHLHTWGRDCNAILELWTPPADTLADTITKEAQWAVESIQYLKEVLL